MCIQGTGRLFPGEQGGAAAHEEPRRTLTTGALTRGPNRDIAHLPWGPAWGTSSFLLKRQKEPGPCGPHSENQPPGIRGIPG